MSPLGPLSVFPLPRLSIVEPNHYSSSVLTNNEVHPQEQLFRLMSLGLLKDSTLTHGPTDLNHLHQNLGWTLGKSRTSMTLKMDRRTGGGNSNIMLHNGTHLRHGIRNFINSDPEGEDDEVLSIGRDTDPAHAPTSDRLKRRPQGDETDGEIDVDDSMSTVTTRTTTSHSPSPSSSHSVRSPTPETSVDHFRLRNYSSEDSLSMKSHYNPLSSLSEAFITNSFHQEQQRQHQASLFFSIANILRPDFGLGRLSLPNSVPPPPPPIGFMHHFNKHHRPLTKRGKSDFRSDQPPKKKSKVNKPESVTPIDLSRPSATPDSSPTKSTPRTSGHKSNHRHQMNGGGNKSPWLGPLNTEKKPESTGKVDELASPLDRVNPTESKSQKEEWPAWVYCTRYSDRPSSGPRSRRTRKQKEKEADEKRPRTAFTAEQLSRLKKEFDENRYLTEKRRQDLANDLQLHENQIKIWFQNKRAKLKKSSGQRGGLAAQLAAQGLYNHSTIAPRGCGDEDEDSD